MTAPLESIPKERSACMTAAVWMARLLGALVADLILVVALAALVAFLAQVLR